MQFKRSWIDDEPAIPYTREQLEELAPRPYRARHAARWDGFLSMLTSEQGRDLLAKSGVSKSPRRLAHFLAQMAHESAGFCRFEENLNYSADRLMQVFGKRYFPSNRFAKKYHRNPELIANRVYDDALRVNKLGNVNAGDGWKYRGRGAFQITGRDNYKRLGQALRVDLQGNPDILFDPALSLCAALWFWEAHNLNAHADKDCMGRITKIINGGYNGLEDRKRLYHTAYNIWAEYKMPKPAKDTSLLAEGSSGPEVKALQERLKALRYPIGETDGHFGEQTHIAVVAFQELHGIPTDGIVGYQTRQSLATAKPRDLGHRAQISKEEAVKKSPTLRKQSFLQWLASGAMAMFGINGASDTGVLGSLSSLGEQAGTLKSSLGQLVPFLQFAAGNLFWIMGLAAAAGVWWYSRAHINEQLDAYRNGQRLEG